MSKLFKSKILLGVLVVVAMFAVVGFAKPSTAAATCSITTTLRAGSVGAEVSCLQTVVGATADGKFGPMTKAAVMAWQSAHTLVADGVFGPLSRAAWLAGGVVSGNYPAGCTSNSGFSSTTGLPCSGGTNLPAGCTSTAGYSPTTGVKCDGGAVSSAPGEGSITVSMESSPSNGTAIAYSTTAGVMALKVKATSSDMIINRVDFNFNKRAWLYVEKAGLYDGSTLIAEKTLTSSSLDEITVGSDYRLRFDGMSYVVPKDATKILTLKLTAPSIINDPNTLVTVSFGTSNIRTTDSTGLITYDGVVDTRTFKVKTTTNGALVASLDSSSPKVGVVAVDDVDNTANVNLLTFGLKATGDTVNITEIPLNVSSSINTGTANGMDDFIESVHLFRDGVELATGTLAAGCTSSLTTCVVTFSDLDEDITRDSTAKFTIKAELKNIEGTIIKENDTVQATLTIGSVVAEDSNYDTVTGLTGSAIGLDQHMFLIAPLLTFITSKTEVDPGDAVAATPVQPVLTGTITFKVKAVGGTIYINKANTTTAADMALLVGAGGINQTASTPDTLSDATYTVSGVSESSDGTDSYYTINDGQEATIEAKGYVTSSTPASLQSVAIEGLQWGTVVTSEATRIAGTDVTWGLEDFHTGSVFLNFY